jgi:hypothetical protein
MEFVLARIITYNSILTISSKAYSVIGNLFTVNHSNFRACLDELDLLYKLDLINGILNNNKEIDIEQSRIFSGVDPQVASQTVLNTSKPSLNSSDNNNINMIILNKNKNIFDPHTTALKYLKISVENIYKELNNIDYRIQRHQNKWFNSWRNLNLEPNLNVLRKETQKLDQRLEHYMKLFK